MTTQLTPPNGLILPIDELLEEIVDSLSKSRNLVLQAPPGAGKTTRIPPALLKAQPDSGQILMLEPRRVAARAAARRIAQEWDWKVGAEVGYRMRFDRQESRETRILVMTEGTLLAWLQADPFLEGVSTILFDEIHERSLQADLGLALCLRVQSQARPDLQLVAMSATLDSSKLQRAMACPVLTSAGRRFEVSIEYGKENDQRSLIGRVAAGVRLCLERTEGNVLVFLPGVGEIRRGIEALKDLQHTKDIEVLPLHGSLPSEDQDRALRRSTTRKVVLATNVAETSVTIPGVTAVVDSGLARILRFDPARGLDRLEQAPIARDSADQRAGRAGREGPGLCLRLWSSREQTNRLDRLAPEIHRVDLSEAVLQLLNWGETDLELFPWIEKPTTSALTDSLSLLKLLHAIDDSGLTTDGRTMAQLPVSPRIARLLIECSRTGTIETGAQVAALLSDRDPFHRRENNEVAPGPSDLEPRLEALRLFQRTRSTPHTPYGVLTSSGARRCLQTAHQLKRRVASTLVASSHQHPSHSSPTETFARNLLAAYPDRVAKRRDEDPDRALMVGNQGLVFGNQTAVRTCELFLALDVRAGRRGIHSEARVQLAIRLEESWLPIVTEAEFTELDNKGKVRAYRRRLYQGLVLNEVEVPVVDQQQIEAVLCATASKDPVLYLHLEDPPVCAFLDRLRSLAEWRPDLGLPIFKAEELAQLLPALCLGCRSLNDLQRSPLLEILKGTLSPSQRRELDALAPTHIQLPKGRPVKLTYRPGTVPVLAARIQQFFGLTETPKIAGRQVKLLLHLLAPNFRPQQVTNDLAGFWKTTYPEVRKELRGRYPKHAWPEDPTGRR